MLYYVCEEYRHFVDLDCVKESREYLPPYHTYKEAREAYEKSAWPDDGDMQIVGVAYNGEVYIYYGPSTNPHQGRYLGNIKNQEKK